MNIDEIDWRALGVRVRAAGKDAREGTDFPPIDIGWSFFLENPECFLPHGEDWDFPEDIPAKPPLDFIVGYRGCDPWQLSAHFDRWELATILAALRYWQREGLRGDPKAELDIASDGQTLTPMTPEEIDRLCARLNFELEGPRAASR